MKRGEKECQKSPTAAIKVQHRKQDKSPQQTSQKGHGTSQLGRNRRGKPATKAEGHGTNQLGRNRRGKPATKAAGTRSPANLLGNRSKTTKTEEAFYKSRLSKIRVTSSETAWTDVLREVSIMKTLEHPNIINLIEVIDDPDSDRFFMVLEYVEGKCICDASGQCGGIGEEISRRRLRDIISGLSYLHAHGVVHGDIKPENLLVTKGGAVKIGDFSISHAFEDDNDLLWRSPGTPVFTAPECCIGLDYHGKTADVWAVGVTLYCMIFGYCPFIGESLQETYDKIVNSPLHISEDLDPELEELLRGLLCKDPTQRMTLESAARHPWLTKGTDPIPQPSGKCRCGSSLTNNEGSSEGSPR
ncbi:hypothetical protein IEQ34_004588 [Dendrobium chrysotoxum]|uniref:Protein kinase domain-containing protein n=1 Tax=Dendrobium chrysotoxum TaxID=161865 RepID=A0AAV7HGT9_DENCH|nr:hypothetical protein IEQ34_004588 [Dendrobium chrysotoxum]